MQLHREITLTEENDNYVTTLWRISGIGVNEILNAALDAKREKDADLIGDINAMIARIQRHLGKNEEPEAPESTPFAAETPEKPKRRGGRPRKSLTQFVEEVHEADKMSKDEFVEYFGGK